MTYLGKNLFCNLRKISRPIRNITNSRILRNDKVPEEALPKNLIEKYYHENLQPKGSIYDKRPFKMKLVAGKKYFWCSCGNSKSQPLCDGTHKIVTLKIKLKPVPFMVEETKEYWLCNCKQTDHRPFCDGNHNAPSIQKIKHFKT